MPDADHAVYRSCASCGGTWFRLARLVRLAAQAPLPTAPGAEPMVLERSVSVVCAGCGAVATEDAGAPAANRDRAVRRKREL